MDDRESVPLGIGPPANQPITGELGVRCCPQNVLGFVGLYEPSVDGERWPGSVPMWGGVMSK